MNPPALWTYLGFVVAFLILIWAIVEMRSRLIRTRRKTTKMENTWVRLDSTRVDVIQEEALSLSEEENEDQVEKRDQDLQTRAQQNGHYSESKKPL